jgi:hypothetical protein
LDEKVATPVVGGKEQTFLHALKANNMSEHKQVTIQFSRYCFCGRVIFKWIKGRPNARGYNWATLLLGEINAGTWPSRLGEPKK